MGFKKIYIQIMCILLILVIVFSVYTVMNREETPSVPVSTENLNEIGMDTEELPLDTESESTEVSSMDTEQITETEDDPVEVTHILYANAAANVRSGPGTTYSSLGRFQVGEEVNAVGEPVDGWQKIIYNGQVAYVSAEYLSDTPPQEPEEPSRPNPPEEPDEPEEPEEPDEPDEPVIPEDPVVPEEPVEPDEPVNPEV